MAVSLAFESLVINSSTLGQMYKKCQPFWKKIRIICNWQFYLVKYSPMLTKFEIIFYSNLSAFIIQILNILDIKELYWKFPRRYFFKTSVPVWKVSRYTAAGCGWKKSRHDQNNRTRVSHSIFLLWHNNIL